MYNKTKTDRIHDLIPKVFKTRTNPNWKAMVEAYGDSDEFLSELIQEVRKQFFIKTASSSYIDRLGANVKVSRPRLVGMDDASFRDYVPVLAYQPKQVKLVIDKLLDIFFFKESTTTFIQSNSFENFTIKDGWALDISVDSVYDERIIFKADDFTDILNASADEVVGAYNRQAEHTFAVVFDDRIKKQKFIRIFSQTVGAKGSIEIAGGLANKALQFSGYNDNAGSKANTSWTITKTGDTMTFTFLAGDSAGISNIQLGDVAIINTPSNEGSFVVTDVNAGANSFSYVNVFGAAGVHNHTGLDTFVNFLTPEKTVIYTKNNRAVTWEVTPGEIIIEMPASPPVVKRDLKGSAHINSEIRTMQSRDSASVMTLDNTLGFPTAGKFLLQQQQAIVSRISTPIAEETVTTLLGTRFDKKEIFKYTGISGSQLTGITPDLPEVAQNYQSDIISSTRTGADTTTVTTATAHGFNVGEAVAIQDTQESVQVDVLLADTPTIVATKTAAILATLSDFGAISAVADVTLTAAENGNTTDTNDVDSGVTIGVVDGTTGTPEVSTITCLAASTYDVAGSGLRFNIWSGDGERSYYVWYNVTDGANTQSNPVLSVTVDGTSVISEVPSLTSFKYISIGDDGTSTGGTARVERVAMANTGSLVHLSTSNIDTGITGPYVWDLGAAFVLSSLISKIQVEINAGQNVRTLPITTVNNIPDEEGFIIFDYGTEFEEGPVRYLFKPTDASMQLDPAYIFQFNHTVGSSVTVIRNRGPIVMSGAGLEYSPYVTDPAIARIVLQDLIQEVKSVGIFLEFLIRFPEQLYATLDVYKSGNKDLWPVEQS
ncbi:MAG: hypothetical protein Q9M19_05685 [Mariprofundaceae bacterium]|nr:hypothetical protein [Mariprofundaceae bacterium]